MTQSNSNDDADKTFKKDISQETIEQNPPSHNEEQPSFGEEFFEDTPPPQQSNLMPPKPQRSLLVVILIIAFSIALGLLIFSYIYDLAGIRSFTSEYQIKQNTNSRSVTKDTEQNTAPLVSDTSPKQKDDSLNASKQVQQEIQETKQEEAPTSDNAEPHPTEAQPVQASDSLNAINPPQDIIPNHSLIQTQEDYTKKVETLHKTFKHISNQFLLLNQKLMQSEPYLDILIDIRSELNSKKVTVPTLTEYAAAGFPTDMIIATDGMKSLKKLSIIAARKDNSDSLVSFIKNFAIITPQSNTQGLTGVYRHIGKALDDGDFNQVERLIGESSPQIQHDLRDLYILVADKKAIYAEIKLLNDVIIDTIFQQTQNNTEN